MDRLVTPARRRGRRRFLRSGVALAGLSLVSGCGIVAPQSQPAKVRRIGFLVDAPDDTQIAQLLDGFRELGYVEGENFAFERRFARGDVARFQALIAELEELDVECIVCGGLAACISLKQANESIPAVSWQGINDVVEAGLVQNIARPEGNMTGTAGVSGLQFHAKLLEILNAAVPGLGRVGVLAYARLPSVDVMLDGLKDAAGRLGLQLEIVTVQDADGIESAFPSFSAAGARALLVVIGLIFLTSTGRPRIAELALAHRLPSASPDSAFPQAGGLLAYSPNRPDNSRRAAWYVDGILNGAKPAELLMERPTKFDLILNLKTAQALGLTVPKTILEQATEVIQ